MLSGVCRLAKHTVVVYLKEQAAYHGLNVDNLYHLVASGKPPQNWSGCHQTRPHFLVWSIVAQIRRGRSRRMSVAPRMACQHSVTASGYAR
jgi:hypothetical protein